MPDVTAWLVRFGRWRRYGAVIFGDDPEERELRAFDAMTAALQLPLVDPDRG